MILLLFQHTFLPISTWKLIIYHCKSWFQNVTFFLTYLKWLFNFEVNWRLICWHPHIPINVSSITAWKIYLLLEALGLNTFNYPWKNQLSYVFLPPILLPPAVLEVSGRTHHKSIQPTVLVAPCWVEVPWLPTVLNKLEYTPSQCPLSRDVLVGQALKGLPSLILPCSVLYRQGLFSSICQTVAVAT